MSKRRGMSAPLVPVAAGLLLILLFAGCLSPVRVSDSRTVSGTPRITPAVHLAPRNCPSDVVSNCAEITADPDVPYRIEGLSISGDRDSEGDPLEVPTGVLIEELDRGVILQDVWIEDFDRGIVIRNMSCGSCRVAVQNSDVSLRDGAVHRGWGQAGIEVVNFAGRLSVERSIITLGGGGQGNPVELPWNAALQVSASAGVTVKGRTSGLTVTLADVRLKAIQPAEGWGVQVGLGGLHEGTILPPSGGVSLTASDAEVSGFDTGIAVQHARSVRLEGTRVTSARQGIWVKQSDAFSAEDVTVRNASVGAYLLDVDETQPAEMQDLLLHGQRLAGLYLNATRARITDSNFIGNGHGWPSDEPTAEPRRFGGLVVSKGINDRWVGDDAFRVQVHGSSFEANVPFALSNNGEPIDARNNWWNDSEGPRVKASLGPATVGPVGDGDGEVISDRIQYAPWLRSEP